jgi:hypothetical protein
MGTQFTRGALPGHVEGNASPQLIKPMETPKKRKKRKAGGTRIGTKNLAFASSIHNKQKKGQKGRVKDFNIVQQLFPLQITLFSKNSAIVIRMGGGEECNIE